MMQTSRWTAIRKGYPLKAKVVGSLLRRGNLVAVLLLLSMTIIVLAGCASTQSEHLQSTTPTMSRLPPPGELPTTQPIPSYAAVYPGPEQVISLSSEGRKMLAGLSELNARPFVLPVYWEPGLVCVQLAPSSLLQRGDFWRAEDIMAMSSLTLNSQELPMISCEDGIGKMRMSEIVVEYDMTAQITTVVQEEKEIAGLDGGPWGMCWQGPREVGQYVAVFRFSEYSYSWWYRIEH